MTSARTLDEAIEIRIQEMGEQIFLLESVQNLLDTAKRIGEATKAENYGVLRSELVRLKSRCDALIIIAASYESSYDHNAINLLFSDQGGGYENE